MQLDSVQPRELRRATMRLATHALAMWVVPVMATAPKPTLQFDDAFGDSPFLVVINFRSNSVISWTSPRHTLLDALESETQAALEQYSEGIGHAALFFRNETGGAIIGIGQTGANHGQGQSLLLHGLGFTAITNMVFTDGSLNNFGFLDTKSALAMEHRQHGRQGIKFGFLGFRLTAAQAGRVQSFLDEYRATRAYSNYGFPVDPLKFEGGGCTSFANAVVEKAGLDFPLRSQWARTVHIPLALMGYDAARINETEYTRYDGPPLPAKSVNPLKVVGYNHWAAPPPAPGWPFSLYDPELFYLASAFSRNALLVRQRKPPVAIVDIVPDDPYVDAMRSAAEAWLNATTQPLEIVTLYGMQGLRVG